MCLLNSFSWPLTVTCFKYSLIICFYTAKLTINVGFIECLHVDLPLNKHGISLAYVTEDNRDKTVHDLYAQNMMVNVS